MTGAKASSSWEHLTWPEIGQRLESGQDAAILPVGATEQHGPHLGVGMDTALAERLALAVSASTGVPCLPALPYGCSIGHSHRWPGTLALNPKTLIDVIADIGRWFYKSGGRRLFLVNGHVGNRAPLRCALEVLRAECEDFKIAIFTTGDISDRVAAAFSQDAADWHANAAETALMMHLSPESVRFDRVQDADDPDRTNDCVFAHPVNRTSLNGVTGKPSTATSAMGEQLFAIMVDDLSEHIMKGLQEASPLEFPYN
ncbi:MAG: creatininase family protein [Verrucomicrobiota bacterium]